MPPLTDDRTAYFAFDMRDWRFDHDAADQLPEGHKVPWRVSIVRKGDGIVLIFQRPNGDAEPERRKVLVEVSRGRPKLNIYSAASEDACAIVFLEHDHVLVTTGGFTDGLGAVRVDSGEMTSCPPPEI